MLSGAATEGDQVQFSVPVPGLYDIEVLDGRTCPANFQMDLTACNAVTVQAGSANVLVGGSVCVPFTVSGFDNLSGLQFTIEYDPSVLTFTTAQNFNSNVSGLNNASFNEIAAGQLAFLWTDLVGTSSVPDGEVLFEICFDAIGTLGEMSDIEITDNPVDIEAGDASGQPVPVSTGDGVVTISTSTLLVTTTQEDATCNGGMDGEFTLTASGGAAPYNFVFTETGSGTTGGPITIFVNGGTATINNLPAGTYEITLTDSATPAATTMTTVVIGEPGVLGSTINFEPQQCPGDLIPSATVLILENNLPVSNPQDYTILWSTGDMTTTITDLDPSQAYSVTITPNNGCPAIVDNENPVALPPISINVTNNQAATCSGINDGTLTFNVTGGTPDGTNAYTIEIPEISLTINNNMFNSSSLEPGPYEVLITDDNGCMYTETIVVAADKSLVPVETVTNILCAGDMDGSIAVTINTQGGPAATPYQFTWVGTPPPPPSTDTPTSTMIDGLAPGNYTLLVEDQAGCSLDLPYTITSPDPLQLDSLSVTAATCLPGNDGEAVIGVSGGTFPYTYVWTEMGDTLAGQTDSILTNANAGLYIVRLTDANGCMDTVQITIPAPQGPVIVSLDDDNLDCAEDTDGSLTVVATDGAAAITGYQWSNGGTTPTIDNLSPGTYFVTISDAGGCGTVDSAIVFSPPALVIDSIVGTPPSCADTEDGSLAVFVSGGTQPYTYFWSTDPNNGSTFNLLPSLGVGDYTVTIVDANGCDPVTTTGNVPSPATIVITFDPASIDSVSCANAAGVPCDGGAMATAAYSDGTVGSFTFTWESGESDFTTTMSTASQLCEGFQTLTVGDNFCSVTDSVLIPAPLPITPIEFANERVSCFGDTDGALAIGASGGSGGYMYQWTDGPTTPVRSDLAPGSYTVVISDAKGCVFQYQTSIDEPDPFELTLNTSATFDVSCFGESDGIITVDPSGGNTDIGDVTYTWNPAVAPSSSNFAEGLESGVYTVVATDIKGCEDELTTTIDEPDDIDFVLAPIDPILCFGDRTTIAFEQVFGGNGGPYLFSVNNSPPNETVFGFDVFGGEQVITVFDIQGCTSSDTLQIDQPAQLIVDLPAEIEVELGDSVTLVPVITNETPVNLDSVFWTPTNDLTFGNNPLRPTVSPVNSQTYTLTLFDENGCEASDDIFVRVDKNRNVFVPNAFSPNGNGRNERFRVFTGAGVRSIDFIRVFDRWGELIYEQTDVLPNPNGTDGWDGRFRGQEMKPGVYVYLVGVTFEDDVQLTYRGDVSLLR